MDKIESFNLVSSGLVISKCNQLRLDSVCTSSDEKAFKSLEAYSDVREEIYVHTKANDISSILKYSEEWIRYAYGFLLNCENGHYSFKNPDVPLKFQWTSVFSEGGNRAHFFYFANIDICMIMINYAVANILNAETIYSDCTNNTKSNKNIMLGSCVDHYRRAIAILKRVKKEVTENWIKNDKMIDLEDEFLGSLINHAISMWQMASISKMAVSKENTKEEKKFLTLTAGIYQFCYEKTEDVCIQITSKRFSNPFGVNFKIKMTENSELISVLFRANSMLAMANRSKFDDDHGSAFTCINTAKGLLNTYKTKIHDLISSVDPKRLNIFIRYHNDIIESSEKIKNEIDNIYYITPPDLESINKTAVELKQPEDWIPLVPLLYGEY